MSRSLNTNFKLVYACALNCVIFFHLRVGLGLQIRNGERSKFLALFKGNIHNKDAQHDDLICFVYPQLSCYSEFNKMVHALSVHSKGETVSTLHPPRWTPSVSMYKWRTVLIKRLFVNVVCFNYRKGTSAEYNFYQTLSIMLNQVLR